MKKLPHAIVAILVLSIVIFFTSTTLVRRHQTTTRRDHFMFLASDLRYYIQGTNKHVFPLDFRPDECDCCKAKPNSWRMAVFGLRNNEDTSAMREPWYSPKFWELRSSLGTIYNQPGAVAPIFNSVTEGGISVPVAKNYDERVLIVVEAYPQEGSWMEAGDLDLHELLKSKSVSDALSLNRQGRSAFLAIFSDFSCWEIDARIPNEVLDALISEGRSHEPIRKKAEEYVVWRLKN